MHILIHKRSYQGVDDKLTITTTKFFFNNSKYSKDKDILPGFKNRIFTLYGSFFFMSAFMPPPPP